MKVLFFANKMPDLCGAFLHDIDLAIELQRRGHQVVFLTIRIPREGYHGGTYRGFRFLHYTAASSYLDTSEIWLCPHSPILPDVRKINSRGYDRPLFATCHFDGSYNLISQNAGKSPEMLGFLNRAMEPHYRAGVNPWPSCIVRTEVIRPIMHRDKITIEDAFEGEHITLINANENKGVRQFLDMARKMPDHKFLGVLPYYGERFVPPAPSNVTWIPFDDDIRTILRKTRILVMPSYYESFGRVAVEAMVNGIPVVYSKPIHNSLYPGGSTEGVQEWIGDAAIACERDNINEWVEAIETIEEDYEDWSEKSKTHIDEMNLFTEASRIASLVEAFAREHPVTVRSSQAILPQTKQQSGPAPPPLRTAPIGFANGRLRIQR